MSKTSESIPQIFSKEIIVDSENNILTITGDGISGSGQNLYNLTSSNISNFTNDVRSQFSAGTNISIINGLISSAPGSSIPAAGINGSIQFNSGSIISGSSNLVYDYINDRFGIGTSNPTAKLDIYDGVMNVRNSVGYAGTFTNLSQNGMYLTLADTTNNSAIGTSASNLIFYNNSNTTERMRIDYAGNVGIGTMAPNAKLHVTGTLLTGLNSGLITHRDAALADTIEMHIRPNAGKKGYITFTEDAVADRWVVGTENSVDALLFKAGGVTSNTERMRLTNAGNLGIGTTSPQNKLHVSGNGAILNLEGTDHSYIQYYPKGFSSGRKSYVGFGNPTNNTFSIANEWATGGDIIISPGAGGNVGIATTTPNYTLSVTGTLGVSGNTTISTISGTTAQLTVLTGSTVTGSTALFAQITGSHSGSGAGLFGIPNSGLVNSSVTVGTTNISLGSSATTIQGITVLTGSTVTGSTALFAQITAAYAAPPGALTTPSYSFIGDPNTGLYSPGADTIVFVEGGNEALRISSNSTITASTDITITNGNIIINTSGKGINFSGTPSVISGTMSSELLNDYEEGTWSPTLQGDSTSGSYNYITNTGRYTKIGNCVYITGRIQISSSTPVVVSGTGNATIGSLPFSISNTAFNAGRDGGINFYYFNGLNINVITLSAFAQNPTSRPYRMLLFKTTGSSTTNTAAALTDVANASAHYSFQGFYYTDL